MSQITYSDFGHSDMTSDEIKELIKNQKPEIPKEEISKNIAKQTKEFLASGRRITPIKAGITTNFVHHEFR